MPEVGHPWDVTPLHRLYVGEGSTPISTTTHVTTSLQANFHHAQVDGKKLELQV